MCPHTRQKGNLLRHKSIKTYSLQVVYFSSSARRDRGLLRLSECRAVLARAMPSVSNLVDRQMSPCDGGVIVHTLIIRLYVLKNILSSSNPLGLQPLPLYFTYVKHMGRKGHPVRDGIFFLPITPRRVVSFSSRLPRGVWSLFPPLLVEIGEVLPCNGGVRKSCINN